MVGVQQDGGPALGRGTAGDDGGSAGRAVVVHAEDAHVVDPDAADQRGDGLGAAIEFVGVEGVPGDALDRDEIGKSAARSAGRPHPRWHGGGS